MYTHPFRVPTCSAAPQATPPGYSHRATQLGATHYGSCRTSRALGCRGEEEVVGGGEELGNFKRPGPPWALSVGQR